MGTGKLSDYRVISEIGTGSFGKCCKIERISTGQTLVWKEVYYGQMSESEKESLVREVNLLRELNNPFIVRYVDRIVQKPKNILYLVMEYCAGGDLSQLISKQKELRVKGDRNAYLPQLFVFKVFKQLLNALKHLHSNDKGRILHRDLKPANVFLTDHLGDVKLGDFGLARVLHSEVSMAVSYVGTPYYMSPEQVNKQRYDEMSDVWSLGCLIYELCALHPPFTARNQNELYSKIKTGQFRRIPSKYPDELQQTIQKMLYLKPQMRPTVQELEDSNVFEEKSKISPAKSKLPLLSKTSSPKSGSLQRQRKSSESLKTDSGFGSNTTSASSLPQVDKASPSVPHRKPSRPNSRPPSRDQSRPNSSNNNYARIEATESKVIDVKSLEAWEERLSRWEAELKKRESYLFDKEKDFENRVAKFKSENSKPSSSPLVKLQNRLIPLMPRKQNAKLRRSPSDPVRTPRSAGSEPNLHT